MFYVIQTNTSLNDYYQQMDFQSIMYKIHKQTWEEFKEYILSTEDYTEKLIEGTMLGYTKSRYFNVIKVLINDDIHLECIFQNINTKNLCKSQYYMVNEEAFKNLL